MRELLDKLLKLKTSQKVALTAVAALVIAGGYYTLYYAELSDEIDAETSRAERLKEERTSYEKRKREYLAYRAELKELQEEQRELLKVLPKKDEVASFLHGLQEQADLAGVETVNLLKEAEIPDELYVKIPVRVEVRGTFHNVTKFFKNVSEMKRIVNVENLSVSPDRTAKDDEGGSPKLKVKFVAATFRFADGAGGGT